jgi:hypothetical protein
MSEWESSFSSTQSLTVSSLAVKEDDPLDRFPPTIRYLQKLGPSELQLIFNSSKWIFNGDPKRALEVSCLIPRQVKLTLQIFIADEPEVEALPRKDVMDFLAKTDLDSCIKYLEHIIDTLGETGADFHDRLAQLYLQKAESDRRDAGQCNVTCAGRYTYA